MAARTERSTLNILDYKFLEEEFRCFLCKGYLSCGPVRLVLPDGKSICGHCPSPESHSEYLTSNTGSIYRNVPLENILRTAVFPCRFMESGCTESILFGQVDDHESKCAYQTIACPSSAFGSCAWKGLLSEVLEHFLQNHSDYIKSDAKLTLQLNENSKGVLMTIKNNVLFIVKYFYDAYIIKYDITYCAQESKCEIISKVQLINDSDTDCTVSLKATSSKCLRYDSNLNNLQNVMILDLKRYLPVLDDPNSITINLHMTTTTSENSLLNLYLFKYFKCQACKKYLLPPLFDLDHNTVCYNCARNNSKCIPSNDTKIIKLVSETNFPCHLQQCKFVGKGDALKIHEQTCQFGWITCGMCRKSFIPAKSGNHYCPLAYEIKRLF